MKKKRLLLGCISIILVFSLCFFIILGGVTEQYKKFVIFEGYNSELNETEYGTRGLSEQVAELRPLVSEYAQEYEIADYVDLLLAVIMQESGGIGQDVFQASESLGLPPNSLSLEQSIAQGVQVMSARLSAAGVHANTDLDGIRLALQGYNFGGGYISYALSTDGKWTQNNTNEFAKIHSFGVKRTGKKAENIGIWAYGDQYYTAHVLRYYTCIFTDSGNNGVVDIAVSCIGCPYVWGATGPNQFDCSGLVYYCYRQSGKYTGGRTTASGYKNIAMPISESAAQPGDLVFFTRNGVTHHVGIYMGNGQMIHAPKPGQHVQYGSTYREKEEVTFGRLSN